MLRVRLSGVRLFAIVALLRTGLLRGIREMRPRTSRKWLEISRNLDFRLTCDRNLDNLEQFAQKRHSLLSGPRKPKLNSSGILSLAPGSRK